VERLTNGAHGYLRRCPMKPYKG